MRPSLDPNHHHRPARLLDAATAVAAVLPSVSRRRSAYADEDARLDHQVAQGRHCAASAGTTGGIEGGKASDRVRTTEGACGRPSPALPGRSASNLHPFETRYSLRAARELFVSEKVQPADPAKAAQVLARVGISRATGWVRLGAPSAPDRARRGTRRSASRSTPAGIEGVRLATPESALFPPPRLRTFRVSFDAILGSDADPFIEEDQGKSAISTRCGIMHLRAYL